jgi:hypothetical protein
MASLNDKVRKARFNASKMETSIAANETVNRNAKTAKVRLTMAEERAATKTLKPRMQLDRSKTAARAVGIEKMQTKKAAAKRAAAAIGNSSASKKPTSKATVKPKKPLTSSEKAFLEGQKKKAKITKKTGIYPNTAN